MLFALLFALLLILLVVLIFYFKKTKYVSRREFAKEAYKWSRRLNSYDLKARNCELQDEYFYKLVNSYTEFTPQDKEKLKLFDARFVKIALEEESMYAYTLSDFIVINDYILDLPEKEFNEIIFHEMVHIWQRKNPEKNQLLIDHFGFKKISKKLYNIRTNPDTDFHLYEKDGKILAFKWNENPTHMKDFYSETWEFPPWIKEWDHPNEIIAYTLVKLKFP